MIDYLGIFFGWFLGILSTGLLEYLRGRREDKLRREELQLRKVDQAQNYFRSIVYDTLKPFLRAHSDLTLFVVAKAFPGLQPKQAPALGNIIQDIDVATQTLIDEGYASLFPPPFLGNILKSSFVIASVSF